MHLGKDQRITLREQEMVRTKTQRTSVNRVPGDKGSTILGGGTTGKKNKMEDGASGENCQHQAKRNVANICPHNTRGCPGFW